MSEIKLLPCPFCGGEAEYSEHHEDNGGVEIYYREYHYYMVSCSKCGLTMASQVDKEGVVRKWNTRKPMQEIVERLEEAKVCIVDDYTEEYEDMVFLEEAIEIIEEVGGTDA